MRGLCQHRSGLAAPDRQKESLCSQTTNPASGEPTGLDFRNAFEPVCPPGGQGNGLRYLTLSLIP